VLLAISQQFKSIYLLLDLYDSAKRILYWCDETFDRFWLVNIKIRCLNIPLWKIIDKQECVAPKHYWRYNGHQNLITQPSLNIRQPFQKQRQNQQLPFHLTYFSTNSLVFVAVAAINISIFLFGKWRTHVFSIFKYKTRS
jgi:hypothetical protein